MAQPTPHFERDSSRHGWTLTKPGPISIGTNRPMRDGPRSDQKARAPPEQPDEHRWHKRRLVYLVVVSVDLAPIQQHLPLRPCCCEPVKFLRKNT
jgi:hypothetical protein